MPLDGTGYTCADARVDIEFLSRSNGTAIARSPLSSEAKERKARLMAHMKEPTFTGLDNVVCPECWREYQEKTGGRT